MHNALQGYDVVAFAEGGKRKATGLDISETALARAREVGTVTVLGAGVGITNHTSSYGW